MSKFKCSHLQVKEGKIQTWCCVHFFPLLSSDHLPAQDAETLNHLLAADLQFVYSLRREAGVLITVIHFLEVLSSLCCFLESRSLISCWFPTPYWCCKVQAVYVPKTGDLNLVCRV